MFNFLKSNKQNKTFASLATDMHCHLLPGVDDGSSSIEESIACLKTMAAVGFQKVYLTPHFQANYPNVESDIQKRFEAMKKHLDTLNDKSLPEVVAVSGEYRFDPRFARRPGVDNVLTLPGKKLLCEFSLHFNDYKPIEIFKEFQQLGYTLILAHPERYPYLGLHSEEIAKMKQMGIFFQINVLSLNGFYGDSAQRKGFEYIEAGMVEYLGTDTHNLRYAAALKEAAENKAIQKMLKNHSFLNSQL